MAESERAGSSKAECLVGKIAEIQLDHNKIEKNKNLVKRKNVGKKGAAKRSAPAKSLAEAPMEGTGTVATDISALSHITGLAGADMFSKETATNCTFSQLYDVGKKVGERVMADIVKVLYSQKFIKSKRGHMPIRTFCKVERFWNDDRIHKKFGDYEKYLDLDLMEHDTLDASFAYKVIIEFCGNALDWLSSNCKRHIKLLKNHSKKICHKYGIIKANLPNECRRLEEMVKAIYNEVTKEFNQDFNISLSIVKDLLDKALSNSTSDSESVPYFFRDFVTLKLIILQQHLRSQYDKLELQSPYMWISNTLNKENKPGLTGYPGAGQMYFILKTSKEGTLVTLRTLLRTTKRLADDEVISPLLLLHGQLGCGKTTLCHYLVHSWTKAPGHFDTLLDFDLVILIEYFKLGSLLLKPYLKDKLLKNCFTDTDKVFTLLKELDVLWILDGFQEAKNDSMCVVKEVLEEFSNHRILLTLRHSDSPIMPLVFASHVDYQTLQLCPQDDQGQIGIAKSVFKDQLQTERKITEKIKQFKDNHYTGSRFINAYLKESSTATLYSAYWLENSSVQLKTARELHEQIFKFSINKIMTYHGFKIASNMCDVTDVGSEFSHLLGKVAWMMLKVGKHILDETRLKMLQDHLTYLGLDATIIMLAFFTCNVDHESATPTRQFSFCNLLQQSHYAAIYLTNSVHMHKTFMRELQAQGLEWRHYPLVLMCMVGQICARNSDDTLVRNVLSLLREVECRAENFPYWWDVCQESERHSSVRTCIADMLPKPHWVLNHKICVPGLKLLSHTPIVLASIKIDIPSNINPYDIPELLPVMQVLPKALGDRHIPPISVELHFWHHDEVGCEQSSDLFIKTLHPWGTLVNLTGELGETKDLIKCRNIRTIRVRVRSINSMWALNSITRRLKDLARIVRVTVALPENCNPSSLPQLSCPNLELNFSVLNITNREWLVAIIKQIGGKRGVWRLSVTTCSLLLPDLLGFVQDLSGYISDKFSLSTVEELSDQNLKALQKRAGFVINFL